MRNAESTVKAPYPLKAAERAKGISKTPTTKTIPRLTGRRGGAMAAGSTVDCCVMVRL